MRPSVKIILIHPDRQILLICADDPNTYLVEEKRVGRFWFLVGGKIETGETAQEACYRELFEESGLLPEDVQLGPQIFYEEYDLILSGRLTRMMSQYFVATTSKKQVTLDHLTPDERVTIQELRWFSHADILSSRETVYPKWLGERLPELLDTYCLSSG